MAKFMLIKISLMAEITDADTWSPDHPETANWHASEEGQEGHRLIATEDKTALRELLDEPMLPLLRDGVPGCQGRLHAVVR